MPIELPEGSPALPDPRIEKVLDFLGVYQSTLRGTFDGLPDEAKASLAGQPNPHLATGPMEVVVCTNGVFAAILNGLERVQIECRVVFPHTPNMTVVGYFNSVAESAFTFMDPLSKLTAKGNVATFEESAFYDGALTNVLIVDSPNRLWYPRATKVFLIGWRFFDVVDLRSKAEEMAKQSLTMARGHANLRSKGAARNLLEHYRELLNTATSESPLQAFLQAHPEFLYPDHVSVVPKPSLGGERYPDFAFSFQSAFGVRWLFVEIERPTKRIFTTGQEFQFHSEFTQAKGQLLQWDALITKDHQFFARRFPGLIKPEFHLVYGRDNELDASRREMLVAEFSAAPNRTFSTFDDLATRFERIVDRIFP